jgi:hypothetical protein
MIINYVNYYYHSFGYTHFIQRHKYPLTTELARTFLSDTQKCTCFDSLETGDI